MGKRRITAAEIAVGSILPWDAYDRDGWLLLRRGHVVASSNQIEGLIGRGLFVETDSARDKTETEILPDEEPPSAVSLVLEARRRLQSICAPSALNENFPQQAFHIRELIREACKLSQDVALAMILLEHQGRYSIRHSVDAAITCHVVGTALGIQEPELSATVAAALTMNISMLPLQDTLQAQEPPLTTEQRQAVRDHPQQSAEILRQRGVADDIWIGAVLNHHEAIDGSGYPSHKKGDEIPLPAQLVSLADVYCARISNRDYRAPLRPNAALRAIFLNQGKVDQGLANQFIKAIGVFPTGTPVRLENGEIAVVTRRGGSTNTPHVCSVIGPRGVPLVVPIQRDTSRALYAVREVVDRAELGAVPSMQALWGKVGAIG